MLVKVVRPSPMSARRGEYKVAFFAVFSRTAVPPCVAKDDTRGGNSHDSL